jgi:hypothetical protein
MATPDISSSVPGLPAGHVDLGQTAATVTLAQEMAGLLGIPVGDAWWSLCNVPAHMTRLLDSPRGWSRLACYIADDLGQPMPDYWPMVH